MELKGLKEVADFITENNNFLVVHHIDADGIAAGAVTCSILKRLEKKYSYLGVKQLDSARIPELIDKSDVFLFVDFGSGQLELLNTAFKEKKFAIIDHHKPHGETAQPHFNVHLSGIDGTNELSGSGTAYLIGKEIDAKNEDLSPIAIVGAIGDMQDSKGMLESLNRDILKDAAKHGLVKEYEDIRLFGRHSRPLVQFLSFCSEPYLPGLTAKEEECKAFLKNIGIEYEKNNYWKKYIDLTQEEKKKLISGLYVYGVQNRVPEQSLKSLVGKVYDLMKEKEGTELRDAREFATLLNACGRHDNTAIGVEVCMGDRTENYEAAKKLLEKHRRMLRDGIAWVQENGARKLQNCYVLDAENKISDTLIGVIAGMMYGANVIQHDKPVIGFAVDENRNLKISARATWALVAKGLDLGAALKNASEAVGGGGGGHTIAAGAAVPINKKEEFLIILDKKIGEQIARIPDGA